MNIGLVVNARGKLCLVHDEALPGVPDWVAYRVDTRQIEILFDNGRSYPIAWIATPEMDHYLWKVDKILIIRMEHKRPVEGYDTGLLRVLAGRALPRPLSLDDGSWLEINRHGELAIAVAAPPPRELPELIEYSVFGGCLSLSGPGGVSHRLSLIPGATDASPEGKTADNSEDKLVEHREELYRTRTAISQELATKISPGQKRELYTLVEQSYRNLAFIDHVGEIPGEIVLHTHARVEWKPNVAARSSALRTFVSPSDATAASESSPNVLIPIVLSLGG